VYVDISGPKNVFDTVLTFTAMNASGNMAGAGGHLLSGVAPTSHHTHTKLSPPPRPHLAAVHGSHRARAPSPLPPAFPHPVPPLLLTV
jgi:hypothetical protein